MRALIVEDELKLASLIRRGLREAGYATDIVPSGESAIRMATEVEYDVIVLDAILPGIDGFEVRRRLRRSGVGSPALMLAPREAVDDRSTGLDSGADDCLTKPFSVAELFRRLGAIRRGRVKRPLTLEVGTLRVDPRTRQAWRGGVEIQLSAKGFALLETLMRRPGHVVSRVDLLEHAWDYDYENRSNIVEVYIHYLRGKIDRPFGVRSIETVRGAGYRLRSDGAAVEERVRAQR